MIIAIVHSTDVNCKLLKQKKQLNRVAFIRIFLSLI